MLCVSSGTKRFNITGGTPASFDGVDTNGYVLGAIRFVQGPNQSYLATSYSLDATEGMPSRAGHVAVGAPGATTG